MRKAEPRIYRRPTGERLTELHVDQLLEDLLDPSRWMKNDGFAVVEVCRGTEHHRYIACGFAGANKFYLNAILNRSAPSSTSMVPSSGYGTGKTLQVWNGQTYMPISDDAVVESTLASQVLWHFWETGDLLSSVKWIDRDKSP